MKYTLLMFLLFSCGLMAQSDYGNEIKLEKLLKTDTTSIGQKLYYPDYKESEFSIYRITIPAGASTGWHKHTFPVFALILKGRLTIEFEDHKSLEFNESSSFAEVINTFHNGVNKTNSDAVLIAFFMGGKGIPLSIKREK